MRITFIGGTRFIGAAAVRRAVDAGHAVTVLHRGVHPNTNPAAQSVIADRSDPDALREALAGTRPDVVVDTRAMTHADATRVISAMRGVTARAVVLSSQDVYAQFGRILGHPAPDPEPEVHEGSPLTVPFPYRELGAREPDYDKKEVEGAFEQAVLDGVIAGSIILRLPAVYGPGDYQRRFGAIVDALDEGDPVPRTAGARWRWTHSHVEDVGHAIALAATSRPTGSHCFNVGEAETPTMGEWTERIATHMGTTVRWTEEEGELPAPFSVLGIMPNDIVVSSARIRSELGFSEVTTKAQRIADIVAEARARR